MVQKNGEPSRPVKPAQQEATLGVGTAGVAAKSGAPALGADEPGTAAAAFFRDAEECAKLATQVLPALFEGKSHEHEIRVWSVDCATGEEAYSLAILLLEEAARHAAPPGIRMFASDPHSASVQQARTGFYSTDHVSSVSPERLQRFFSSEAGGYRVRKEVRRLVVFAAHDVGADPPFSRIDLVVCCKAHVRRSPRFAIELFHRALRADGFLVLGGSAAENTGDLYRVEDEQHGICRKRDVRVNKRAFFPTLHDGLLPPRERTTRLPSGRDQLHRQMVERYAPPSALVDPDGRTLHLSAHAGRYLVHPAGAAAVDIVALVRQELRVELRACLRAAREQGRRQRSAPIEMPLNGVGAWVVVDVRPVLDPEQAGHALVIFDEREPIDHDRLPPRATATSDNDNESVLREQLELSRQHLQTVMEEHERDQEIMRASHEAALRTNEDLCAALEELETGREELQSLNEELHALNDENRHRVDDLARLSSDLQNLLVAADIATLFLDDQLRVLRFTPKIAEIFNVRSADAGRPISDLTRRLGYEPLERDAAAVLEQRIPLEREIQDESGAWYLTRLLPYRGAADQIEGVVITFVPITAQKRAEEALRLAKTYAEQIVEALPDPLLVLGPDLVVQSANAAFYEHFGVAPSLTLGRKLDELCDGQWNIPALRQLLEDVLPNDRVFKDYQLELELASLGRRVMLLNGQKIENMQLILLGIRDVTERHAAERALSRSQERLQRMINIEGIGVLVMDATGSLIDANTAFLRMLGYDREDVDARRLSWQVMTPPEYVEVTRARLQQLEEKGRTGPYQKEYLRKDGSRSWMLFVAASLGDGSIVKYCIDINDRQMLENELHESRARLQAELTAMTRLHDLVAQLLVSTDLSAALDQVLAASIQIVDATQGTVHLWHTETHTLELAAQSGFDENALQPFSRSSLQEGSAWARAARTCERVVVEDVDGDPWHAGQRETAGRTGYRAVQSTPLVSRNGGLHGILTVYYPEPHQPSERENRVLDLYSRQAADFIDHVRYGEAADAANRRKDEFLATLAHELRNPLAPIAMGLELIKPQVNEPGVVEDAHRTMTRQLGQLTALVDDLLDVSRITRGVLSLKRRRITVADVIVSAVEEIRPASDEAGHTLTIDVPSETLYVDGDPHRLAQVLSNLLNNSIKFTPSGGEIRLRARRDGNEVVLTVQDNGIGIDPAARERIFDMYSQLDRLHAGSGLGIGLTLVKSLVELHAGSVDVHSDGEGRGSIFTVRLPVLARALPRVDAPAKSKPVDQFGLRVLVVDDSKPAADILAKVLERLGNDVRTAYDGQQATRIAAEFSPAVVIMDIGMPVMDGYAAARHIRSQEWGKKMILVALTGWGQDSDREKTREAGFDMHLVKPTDASGLRDVLSHAKERHTVGAA